MRGPHRAHPARDRPRHQLTYDRPNHDNPHVHGFHDRGSTTTPFDMCVLNELDRFHLALAALERVPRLAGRLGHLRQRVLDRLAEHAECVRRTGDDLPAVRDWTWRTPLPDGATS